jgi:hypothetical protein
VWVCSCRRLITRVTFAIDLCARPRGVFYEREYAVSCKFSDVCLMSVCLFYLAVNFSTNSVLQSYHLGLQRCCFSNPSRLKLQEMAAGNFQMDQIRRSIGYIAYKFLSLRGR